MSNIPGPKTLEELSIWTVFMAAMAVPTRIEDLDGVRYVPCSPATADNLACRRLAMWRAYRAIILKSAKKPKKVKR